MISKTAVTRFVRRPLRDLGARKHCSPEELADRICELDPAPQFSTRPHLHQLVGFLACVDNDLDGMALFYDMGTGKTKIVLDAFAYRKKRGDVSRLLVLVPNTILTESWRQECVKHRPELRLTTSLDEDARLNDIDVVVITYTRWLRLVTEVASISDNKGDGGKRKWSLVDDRLAKMVSLFDAVVFDESTALMNHRSLTFSACKAFLKTTRMRVALSGTPFGRDPQRLWSQLFAVDGGASLGRTLGIFRATFFTESKNYWGGYEYHFRRSMISELRRMLAHTSIRYEIDECEDLPPQVFQDRPVVFSEEQQKYYQAALERARVSVTVEELKESYMSMRRLASGFAVVDGHTVDFVPNAKINYLLEFLEDLPPDEKVVVFHVFVHSGELIQAALASRKIGSAWIYGGTKDKAAELRKFLDDPSCRVFVGNSQSTSMGLNLQCARYVVFYEAPNSPIIREQAERRVWRPGQTRKVVYQDLFLQNSIEEKLLGYLREGKDLFEAVVNRAETLE